MIKVENIKVYNLANAVYSARNPLQSWDKSTSDRDSNILCDADLDLAKRLYKAGKENAKYMRQIFASMDITAPLYWTSEFDTYKVGVTRNSTSFMHKGVSKPFEINDFSVHDERVYEVLNPLKKKEYDLIYPYETDEYKRYTSAGGRTYRVYRNGKVIAEAFDRVDSYKTGRKRHYEEQECHPSKTKSMYYEIQMSGREKWVLHRLVASLWLENTNEYMTVDHKDGNKGNNCVENLEWMPLEDNIRKGFKDGLFEREQSLHRKYISWKNGHTILDPFTRSQVQKDHRDGLTCSKIAEKYDITIKQANNIICSSPNELFLLCYYWEAIINSINEMRNEYLETKDDQVFQQIRCLLPCGYNMKYTVTMNYAVIANMITQRKNHRLDEWREFCDIMLKELPYLREIMGDFDDE